MTVVLSMTSIFNSPPGGRGGFAEEGGGRVDSGGGVMDYAWITKQQTKRLTEGGSCRRDCHSPALFNTASERTTAANVANNCITKAAEKTTRHAEEKEMKPCLGVKRKLESDSSDINERVPAKRISPFLNTPKERKEERRKILKISVQKLRQMDDPEHFLRRSVLINNTMKKVQRELREEKQKYGSNRNYSIYRMRPHYDYDVLNNSYLSSINACLFEDNFSSGETEKITDDMTETLVSSLEKSLERTDSKKDAMCDTTSRENEVNHREKQICSEMDTVFNNLIRALGET